MKRCDYCGGDATSDNVSAHDNISVLHYSKIDCAAVLKAEVERLRDKGVALAATNTADLNDPNMRWVVALALAFRQAGATHSPIEPDHEVILRCLKGIPVAGNKDVVEASDRYRDALVKILNIKTQATQLEDVWKEARQIAFDAFGPQ